MDPENLSHAVQRHLPATMDFLRKMVAINSFTTNVAGVNAVADLVVATFAPLGFAATRIPSANAGRGAHLFLTQPDPLRREGAPTIGLISHLDTVFPPEEERRNDFAWRWEGRRIFGPGTNDIKGGTALIYLMLAAMRDVDPDGTADVNWVVGLNACEEVDSVEFGAHCERQLPVETRACLLFEADGGRIDGEDGPNGDWAIVAARKGRVSFTVRVAGRGAHAGGGHAEGANAIVQLAAIVERLAALTDYSAGVTVNVGTISGGTVNNRVPHEAGATLEMRAFDPVAFARARAAILDCGGEGAVRSADGHACRVEIAVEDECAPWPTNAATERLVAVWQATGAEMGWPVTRQERGGLSDGNVLWSRFPTLDGLGPRGKHAHCSERSPDGRKIPEWVDAASFAPKAVLNALAIRRLLAQDAA